MPAAVERSARKRPAEVQIPQYEEVWRVLRNVGGHDVRLNFMRRRFNPLNLISYDPDGPVMRPENGLGELKSAPLPIQLWEVLKAGGEGIKDLSPAGIKLKPRHVLSSRPYDIEVNEQRGDVSVKFLQYQKRDESVKDEYYLKYYFGREHNGWTGREIQTIVSVHWMAGVGPIIEPVYYGNNTFTEELARAEQILNDPKKKGEIDTLVASVRPEVDRVLREVRPSPEPVPIKAKRQKRSTHVVSQVAA